MAGEARLVYYDLEWSNSDIIQIGAASGEEEFSQAVRPGGKMDPFVRKKIKLDVRDGPTGKRQVFDMSRRMFLPTADPRQGFEDFLSWLEELGAGRELVLVSHGNADILVLDMTKEFIFNGFGVSAADTAFWVSAAATGDADCESTSSYLTGY